MVAYQEVGDRVSRRWNVDYTFYKNGDRKYLLFFKFKQTDAITACFGGYSRRGWTVYGAWHIPSLERIKRAGELAIPMIKCKTTPKKFCRFSAES